MGDLGPLRGLGGLRKEDKSNREDQQEGDDESLDGSHNAWLWCL